MRSESVSFSSGGERCAAELRLPDGEGPFPCVVAAHGFGAVKEGGPIRAIERFTEIGVAGVAFDYRRFGESGGEPRQMVDIGEQLDDWRAAVAYARGRDDVDGNRIALWGSSFSGGHVIELAAADPRLAAVIAQAPYVSGIACLRSGGPGAALRLTLAGLRDQAGALAGRDPFRIPIVGKPGSTAVMSSPDALDGYASIYDDDFEWANEVAARIALRVAMYSPGKKASRVACPLLILVAADDVVTPAEPAIEAARAAPRGELVSYAALQHFDVYRGDNFERAMADQTAFLQEHLVAG